jgi:hypothetical protein
MHVEDRQEGHHAPVGAGTDLRVGDLLDRGDQAVRGGEHHPFGPFVVPPRIAKEKQHEQAQHSHHDRRRPALEPEQNGGDGDERQNEGPGLLGETHRRPLRRGEAKRPSGVRR